MIIELVETLGGNESGRFKFKAVDLNQATKIAQSMTYGHVEWEYVDDDWAEGVFEADGFEGTVTLEREGAEPYIWPGSHED